jgi:hypothetical protein
MGKSDDDNAAWRAMVAFSKDPTAEVDPRESWEIHTVKPKQKQTRRRKMTLDRALKQASKAGVKVGTATVKPDGVVLELGGKPPIDDDEPNEWDAVLKKGKVR